MATKTLITLEQGTDYSLQIIVTDSLTGSGLNLTDYTAACKLRKHWASSTAYSLTATVSNAPLGEVTLSANNTTTSSIPPGRYLFDVEITSNTGIVSRALEGTVTIKPEITR